MVETSLDVPLLASSGFCSSNSAIAPVTNTVAALVPLDDDHVPLLLRTGTSFAGATTSGFLSGSFLGNWNGNRLPPLFPSEDFAQ